MKGFIVIELIHLYGDVIHCKFLSDWVALKGIAFFYVQEMKAFKGGNFSAVKQELAAHKTAAIPMEEDDDEEEVDESEEEEED